MKPAVFVVALFLSLMIWGSPAGAAEEPTVLVFDGTGRYVFIALAPKPGWSEPAVDLEAYLSNGSYTAFWVNETPYAFGTMAAHGGVGSRHNQSIGVYAQPLGVSQEVDRKSAPRDPQWAGGPVLGYEQRAPGSRVLQIITAGEGFVQLRVTIQGGIILDYTTGFGVESFQNEDYGRPQWGVRDAGIARQVHTTRVYDYTRSSNWTAYVFPSRAPESELWNEIRLTDPQGNTRPIPVHTSLEVLEPGH